MPKDVDDDKFALELKQILSEVAEAGSLGAIEGVRAGIKEGAKAWRSHARDSIGTHTYRRHGETITSGAYARSIRSHMLSQDETQPAGEIGSPGLPGLTHLLAKRHARIGGGFVEPVLNLEEKVEPVVLDAAIAAAEQAIDDAL